LLENLRFYKEEEKISIFFEILIFETNSNLIH